MKFFSYFKSAWSFFTAIFLAITALFAPQAKSTDTAQLISEQKNVLDQLIYAGQDIANDGEFFYTSNTVIKQMRLTSLGKYTYDGKTMTPVIEKLQPMPAEVVKDGYDHLGGISVYNGKLYASVEGGSKTKACIVVFNTSDLSHTGEIYHISEELLPTGIPWLAVDGDTGYLYASQWAETDSIHVFDTNNNMEYVKTLHTSVPIRRIQGGDFYNGYMYLSSDTFAEGTETCKRILKVDVNTGEVTDFAQRDLGLNTTEAEGLTIFATPDGANVHTLDWNKKTLTVYLRHYAVDF